MPPQAPQKNHFDTTNPDDTREAFHLVSQTIKELNEQLTKFANGSLKPQAPPTKHFDTASTDDMKKSFLLFSQMIKELDIQLDKSLRPQAPQIKHFDRMNSDDIKDSFVSFSHTIKELDTQLDKYKNGSLRVGNVAGLSFAIEQVKEMLNRTRESFFRNATALVPELEELASNREHKREARGSSSERFYIRQQYFESQPSFDALPAVLGELAVSINLLYVRTDEFQEFTAQGSRLESLFSTLKINLSYRASCAKVYSDRLNTTVIQRYIHQFIYDLQTDFEKVAAALSEFTATGIPAVRDAKARAFKRLTNILAAATLFSGVTASTLQISLDIPNPSNTILVVNTLWFTSLVLSVGAALNCVLNGAFVYLLDVYKRLTSPQSNSGKLPPWVKMWMDGSHNLLLGASILTFSAGLSAFTFSSDQALYTPYIVIASMMSASAGLGVILIWILYKILKAKGQAGAIKPSGALVHAGSNPISLFSGGIASAITNAIPFRRDLSQGDVEQVEAKDGKVEESLTQGHNLQDRPRKPGRVKNARKKCNPVHVVQHVPPTELILLDEPISKIELERYGTIRDIAYSDDGKWLAITCAKEKPYAESWTTVFDAKTLQEIQVISHPWSAISEFLKWSPSGKKLIVKFEFDDCFDVWDLDTKALNSFQSEGDVVQDVAWFDEDAILVAGHSKFTKMDSVEYQTEYLFETHIRSIGIGGETRYIILIMRALNLEEKLEQANVRPENRIVVYDMDEEKEIYQVPILEDISCIYPIPGTRDILITHKDQKAFQLWSLDAEIGGQRNTDMLKPRTITSHRDPGDYVGPTRIGGNYNQAVFNVTTSGDIDIWERESGMPYRRFRSSILQEEGVHCFSWRRSDDESATFATAGIESHTLRVWRCEQLPPPKSQNSPESLDRLTMNENSGNHSQPAENVAVAPSSISMEPGGIGQPEETSTENSVKVDGPNSPEVGPSTLHS